MNRELKKILFQAAYLAAVAGTTAAISYIEFAFLRNHQLRNLPRCAWGSTTGICNADEPGYELIARNTIINTVLHLGVFPLAKLFHNERWLAPINLIGTGSIFNLISLPIANLTRYLTMPSLGTNEKPGEAFAMTFGFSLILSIPPMLVFLLNQEDEEHRQRLRVLRDRQERARQRRDRQEEERQERTRKIIKKHLADNGMCQFFPENLFCYDYCFLKLIEDNLENFTKLLNFFASNKINFDDFAKRFGPLGLSLSITTTKSLLKRYDEKKEKKLSKLSKPSTSGAKAGNGIIAENLLNKIFKQQLGFYVGDIEQYRKNMPKVPPKSARPKAARPN